MSQPSSPSLGRACEAKICICITGGRAQNYISFNNYDMVTQSAVAGDGIALGWLGLIDELLQKKQLVQVTEDIFTSEAGYVMSRDKSNLSSGPQRVFDWVADQTNGMGQ